MAQDFTTILYEKEEPVATITMNRPEKLNAWLPITTQEFKEAFEDCQKDDKVKVLVITGAGRAFSSGEDVSVLREIAKKYQEYRARGISLPLPGPASREVRMLLDIVQKPVVAAINGPCAGGGMTMALAADVRIASETASFHCVYLQRGMVPSGEVWFLPRLIGPGPAFQRILMGDSMDAQEAYRLGLLYKVVPIKKLKEETVAVAHHLAQMPSQAVQFTKKALLFGLNHNLLETMVLVGDQRAILTQSDAMLEGSQAFFDKRKPKWE